ncbi:bacillithiol biosynthesis deacetylase BshB2 [Alkalicoccus urumqiensis]|uniref:Bacillithiol biosynthesis deacetylase BshB2 n=1 Tax=Alkalicoccus urumqiensis TaxID=1548213 RepID=A0A2P6MD20_ALKUR|nr:bacillithiol biosynthesis deacetylase BshB2 [Alkalicoccus urumqiensis]PRO64188.1 bacillithiol biosynthesis deacetylase BshB2 [Alkalicoccus urumqiensis]
MSNEHVLVIFPHPDDEAFGVSGTILSHTEAGTPVTYICLTLGEMGRNMGRPVMANRETLPDIRLKELEEAVRLLGIQDLRRFGMRDKTVEFTDQAALVERLSDAINEIQPSKIITFYPGYAVHPDHDATGEAVIRAVRELPENNRPVVHAIAFADGSVEAIGEPDVLHDVSGYREQKLAVIEAHASQTAGLIEQVRKRTNSDFIEDMLHTERFWTYPV